MPHEGVVLHREDKQPQRGVVLSRSTDDVTIGTVAECDVGRIHREAGVRILHIHLQGRNGGVVVEHYIHLGGGGTGVSVANHIEGVGLIAVCRKLYAHQVVARVIGVEQHLAAQTALAGADVTDMQRVVAVVAYRQRQAVEYLPVSLHAHHTVYHQRRIAIVVYRQIRGGCFGNGCITKVQAASHTDIGAVDIHPAIVNCRKHVASCLVAQDCVQQLKHVTAIAMQAQLEASHHTVGAVQRGACQAGEQQGQRVALQTCSGYIVGRTHPVSSETACHIGQRLR